jgi:hypothetical protein
MARIFARGQHIPFTHTFFDSSGDATSPTSASLILSYPSSGWPYRGATESTTLSMTQSATTVSTASDYLAWQTTWASGAAWPGPVHWTIRSNNLSLSVADGEFILRGNPANLTVTSTT